MSPGRYQQIKSTLARALEQDNPQQRHAFLSAVCGDDVDLRQEVQSLLDQPPDQFETVARRMASPHQESAASVSPGRRIGAYELVRELGRGGMGTVWLARRADEHFEKLVAIKLLKRGTDTDEVLARFSAERRIVARLEHPNIARLLDAGTTDEDLPYFVMEYVEGARLTDFAWGRDLSVGDRVRLFLKICDAVHFAHQNLVVHRDLKPANILVTAQGEPKLLDFGIARLLAPEGDLVRVTLQGQQRLTPAYASPEQVRGEPVTTASDVYSLGALLYELLAGQSPHRFQSPRPSDTELVRVIVDLAPPRASLLAGPGATAKLLRGDLDNILATALRKEPEHRYSGVAAFADDLRHYLEARPVRARPATLGYRVAKFIARNKVGVAATALLLAVLLVGIAGTTWQWTVAQAERRKAEERFQILRTSSRTLVSDIHGALINLPGSLDARKLLLQRATEQLDALAVHAADDPRLQRELAEAYQNIAYLPDKPLAERIELFKKAIALDRKVLAGEPGNIAARGGLAMSEINLADFARARGDTDQALQHNRTAIVLFEAIAAEEPAKLEHRVMVWNASYNAAITLLQLGRAAEALALASRLAPVAVALREKQAADSDSRFRRLYLTHAIAGASLLHLGRYEEAITELRAALAETAATRQRFPLGHAQRLDESAFGSKLALALERSGQRDEARAAMGNALAVAETLTTDEPDNLSYQANAALQNSQLAHLLLRLGETAESLAPFRRAVDRYEKLLAADPAQKHAQAELAYAHGGLARALAEGGARTEAAAEMRQAVSFYATIDLAQTSGVSLLRDCAETLAAAAEICQLDGGKVAEARGLFERSLGIWTALRDRAALSQADAARPDEIAHALARCEARTGEG